MCGRARSTIKPSEICDLINNVLNIRIAQHNLVNNNNEEYTVNNAENLTPGMLLYVAYINNNELHVEMMKWGINMNKMTLFNTRTEELKDKPMFNRMMKKNRGIIILDGFYEYKSNGNKQPKIKYIASPANNKYFTVPVVFNNKKKFTILTQPAVTNNYKSIHHRQPVLLSNYNLHNWIIICKNDDIHENLINMDEEFNAFHLTTL